MVSYKELVVWEKSILLVESIYTITRSFPDDEKFGLTSQMRRSAVSIPSNIAEGHDRKSPKEFNQFLRIAYGSSSELETQLIISQKLGFLSQNTFENTMNNLIQIRKMLNKLISSILTKTNN